MTQKEELKNFKVPEYPVTERTKQLTQKLRDEMVDTQGFLESICRGHYDEDGTCLWDLAELRDAIDKHYKSKDEILKARPEKIEFDDEELAEHNRDFTDGFNQAIEDWSNAMGIGENLRYDKIKGCSNCGTLLMGNNQCRRCLNFTPNKGETE